MLLHHSSQLLSLTLITLLICGSVSGDAECIPKQRSLLLGLKHGFIVPSEVLVSWKPGSNCCNWRGITCDPISGNVIGLDLSGHNNTGGIDSDALFGLTSLQSLDLSNNRFDNISIPQPGFEKLTELRRLNLSRAGFAGQIPTGISHLTRLEYLDLSHGDLQLDDPDFHTMMRNLSNLRELHLDNLHLNLDVQWSTTLLTSTPQLQVLSLRYANISGLLNKDVFQLKRLEYLDLSGNTISGVLPDFPKGCALQCLYLSFTNISGSIPYSIGNLKNLTEFKMMGYNVLGFVDFWNRDLHFSVVNLTLDLSYNKLTGVIPASIGRLTQLAHLDLSYNNVTGAIPTWIGCLTQLTHLKLSRNSFTGAVPSSIGKLVNLTELDLAYNGLTGPIPGSLFALPLLQRLSLNNNQLSGELDVFLNASTLLEKIVLSNNQLCGRIPPSFFYLPSLETLSLESNNFSGAIELDMNVTMMNLSYLSLSNNKLSLGELNDIYFHSFPNLEVVGLVGCGLTKVPTFLKNLDAIEAIDLSNNKIGGDIPRWIFNPGKNALSMDLNLSYNLFTDIEGSNDISMSTVSYLDLCSNMLQGSIPLPPPYIDFLDLSNNSFSATISPEFFINLKGVKYFSIASNSITGEIPPSICEAAIRTLVILDLSDNLLKGSIPSCLLENTSLKVLNLGGNQLKGTIPQNINEGCQLKSIILGNNHLEGPLPRSLVNCIGLQVLDLANNHIVDSFPFWLGDHVGLQILSLKANNFYGPLRTSKGQENTCFSSELRILDLSSNHFHGNLSLICFSGRSVMRGNNSLSPLGLYTIRDNAYYFYETNIAVIKGQEFQLDMILRISYNLVDFSNNSLEGGIPQVIGELQHLHVLNLSHNSLTGKIPVELGDLTQLESLDLSANNLSGEIPQHLTALTFLGLLNLSSNNLVGSIPQGGQFSARPNSSFQDNPGLCGIPLSKQCGDARQDRPPAMPPTVTSDHSSSSSSSYVIGLALSVGIGYGVGIAVVLVLQNVSTEFWKILGRCT